MMAMAVIEFHDDRDDVGAFNAELHDEWVVAMIEDEDDGELYRHCIPRDDIKQVVGHKSGDDIDLK